MQGQMNRNVVQEEKPFRVREISLDGTKGLAPVKAKFRVLRGGYEIDVALSLRGTGGRNL